MPETMIEEARRRNVELDAVNGRNLEAIDRFGWAVIMVGPVPDEPFAPFAYTIGLSRLDSPEVIIVGVELRRAGWTLNHVGLIARDAGGIEIGPLPGVLSGDYVLDLREMSALQHDAYLGRLLWFHQHFGTGRTTCPPSSLAGQFGTLPRRLSAHRRGARPVPPRTTPAGPRLGLS